MLRKFYLYGAAALAVATSASLVPSALAEAPREQAGCRLDEATIYFSAGETRLNAANAAMLNRIAADARKCGVTSLVAETGADRESIARAASVTAELSARGLRAYPASVRPAMDGYQPIAARTVTVRLNAGETPVG
ncbi:MAG: hypothetical protein R3C52_10055 [Hyphomonadaceae bacterium]